MSALRALTIIIGVLTFNAQAFGSDCEKCIATSSLQRTITQSLIIVQVVNRDKNCSATLDFGPEVVNLSIEEVLKGNYNDKTIAVRSWYGTCPYGVHLALKEHAIVMLQEMSDIETGDADGTYKLVEDGCSAGQLEVRGNDVRIKNDWIPITTFKEEYLSK